MSQRLTVLSPEPETNYCPKGLNYTLLTESTWPLNVNLDFFKFISQSLTVWSILQDNRKSPVSWYATFQTGCPCSEKVYAQQALTKSQIFTEPSPEAVARRLPLGWNSTPPTQSRWPSPDIIRSPLGTDHSFQVVSSEPVASISFLGLYAKDVTPIRWPLKVFWHERWVPVGSYCSVKWGLGLLTLGISEAMLVILKTGFSFFGDLAI